MKKCRRLGSDMRHTIISGSPYACSTSRRWVGKAKRRADASDLVAGSVFEDFRRAETGRFVAVEAIEKLIRRTRAPWIIMSYSSGGRATAAELNQVFDEVGEATEVLELDYKKNVMAGMRWTDEWVRDADKPNREFLS